MLVLLIVLIITLVGLAYSMGSIRVKEKFVSSIDTTDKIVCITFDDGPHPIYTRQILDILDNYHIQATFFMIGQRMEKYPEVVEEVLQRGHLIANHTYTHPLNLSSLPAETVKQEIEAWEAVMRTYYRYTPPLFRPPRGRIGGSVLTISTQKNYQTILWTVCADNRQARTPEQMAARVKQGIKPGGIILLHDGMSSIRWKDVEATRLIIPMLIEEGYHFVNLPDLLEMEASGHCLP